MEHPDTTLAQSEQNLEQQLKNLTWKSTEQAQKIVSLTEELDSVRKKAAETDECLHFTNVVAEFSLSATD